MVVSKEILKKYNVRAKKSLGQNFLINDNILNEIASVVSIKGENVLEVGPGYGALTEELLKNNPKTLTLIELDNDMIDILNMRLKNSEFSISNDTTLNINKIDILEYSSEFLDYIVIANIPYYITSPILRHFLFEVENLPKQMVILMQKDVGDKILGKGKNKSSVLSLFVSKKCHIKEVIKVGKENFIPSPKVESSVLLFELHNLYKEINDEAFFELIKNGFKEPRKKLIKNLSSSGYSKDSIIKVFNDLGLNENIRGEDLDIRKWCDLCLKIKY